MAQLLFHKYMSVNMDHMDSRNVVVPAMASFWLATKVEECAGVQIRDVIGAFYKILRKRKGLVFEEGETNTSGDIDIISEGYNSFKKALVLEEKHLLIAIGFDIYAFLDAHNPHRYALYVVTVLKGSNELAQSTWNYLNGCAHLDICLRYSPRAVVAAAIYLAGRTISYPLPMEPHPWWAILLESEEELLTAANDIMAVYKVERKQWIEPCAPKDESLQSRTFQTKWIM